jgi:hypothetical protein
MSPHLAILAARGSLMECCFLLLKRLAQVKPVLVLCSLVFVLNGCYIFPKVFGPTHPETAEPPGNPLFFDALAVLPEVTEFAGDGVKLVSIEARFVRPDGTTDTTAPYVGSSIYAYYRFLQPLKSNKRDPLIPLGAVPTMPDHQKLEVSLSSPRAVDKNLVKSRDFFDGKASSWPYSRGSEGLSVWSLGMERIFGHRFNSKDLGSSRIVGRPTFTMKSIWQKAIAAGFPTSAIATIFYYDKGIVIEIPDTQYKLTLDHDLQQVPNKYIFSCCPR